LGKGKQGSSLSFRKGLQYGGLGNYVTDMKKQELLIMVEGDCKRVKVASLLGIQSGEKLENQ